MEQLIKKIQKLREWEHLGLITTTGNTSDKGLNEFLLELENEALRLFAVSGRSEQFVCLCPRTKEDNCDRKEPCKECETCPHFRQTNCH
jgi:hypothetical protein